MARQPGISGFPSTSAFMGGNPNKRQRIQELPKPVAPQVSIPDTEMEDEVWEELDETAVDEIFTLATQMTTEVPEDRKDFKDQPSELDNAVKSSLNNNAHNDKFPFNNINNNNLPSTSVTIQNNSQVFQNHVKNKSVTANANKSLKNNAYSSRFNDFAALSTPHKLPSIPRSSHSSGKVYNSIPMKGGGGICTPAPGTASTITNYQNTTEGYKGTVIKTEDDTGKHSEELLLKQGEISLLRAELQRKEAALEAERLDRCTAIDAAEKRGRDKAASLVLDAETKLKEYERKVERLQGELHFKNREVLEVQNQCRKLGKQNQDQCVSPSSQNRLSIKKSPVKPPSNFKDRFDFSGRIANVKSVEIQTEAQSSKGRQRSKLEVSCSRGKVCGSQQMACLFSSELQSDSSLNQSHCINRWTLNDHWSNLFSHVASDYEVDGSIQSQILSESIKSLGEAHSMLSSLNNDVTKSPVLRRPSFIEKYEGKVVPALSVIKIFNFTDSKKDLQKALEVVSSHLPQLCIKEVIINNRTWSLVLQAVEHLARITPPQLDKTVCKIVLQSLSDFCEQVNSSTKLIGLLQALEALARHRSFLTSLCSSEGNCFMGKLCSVINAVQEEHLLVALAFESFIAVVVFASPDWLYSACSCSAKVLATLLKHIHVALDWCASKRECERGEYNKLLLSAVWLLHAWSTSDTSWWEKVAHLPHYTAVMGAVIDGAKEMETDRQTVDLLCELYEFDEKIFESC